MAEFIAEYYCVDSKGFVYIQDFFPTDGFDLFIYSISVFCGEVLNWF